MPSQVRHVLFYVPLRPGNLILAEMGDGSLRILKDDEPVDGYRWEAGEMDKAVEVFQELKARHLGGVAGAGGSDRSGETRRI